MIKRTHRFIYAIVIVVFFGVCMNVMDEKVYADEKYEEIYIDENSFPDENFRNYVLSDIDDGDEYLTQYECEDVYNILVPYYSITSLKGIEYFSNLEILECQGNYIDELDISQNTKLKVLFAYDNNLDFLNVDNNTELKALYAWDNKLSAIDVSLLNYFYLAFNDATLNESCDVTIDFEEGFIYYEEGIYKADGKVPVILYGDMNHDGLLDEYDTDILKYSMNDDDISDMDLLYGDLNGDGKVTENDLKLLSDYVSVLEQGNTPVQFEVCFKLNYIEVSQTKELSCYTGDKIPQDGVKVVAYYRDGSSAEVTDFKVTGDTSSPGDKTATVYYTEDNVKRSDTYFFEVTAKPTPTPTAVPTEAPTEQPTTAAPVVNPPAQEPAKQVPDEWLNPQNQVITAKSLTKAYGSKKFKISAKTSGTGYLNFESTNKKVATITPEGMVTLKGIGKTTIRITASLALGYNPAYKNITLTVIPKKQNVKVYSPLRGKIRINWNKDKKAGHYQVQVSPSKKFKSGTLQKNFTNTSANLALNKSGKVYYVRVRSYKKIGSKTYFGKWSKVKSVTVR